MLSIFGSPSRYIQGQNASIYLASELEKLGFSGPVLILTSKSPRIILEKIWHESFTKHELNPIICDFCGECSIAEINRVSEIARQSSVSLIIGVGGGKALDAARAVAAAEELPIICCPTTAASDAPCSALSVIYSQQGVFEAIQYYRRNPDLVLVDTSVIIQAPVRTLVSGMGDALATYFEAQACNAARKPNTLGGAPTLAASAIAELCYKTLLQDGSAALAAANARDITPSFERIVEANTLLSGLGFESGGLAIAHSVHNGLTAAEETHSFMHGEKVAFGTLVQLVMEQKDQKILEEVLQFCVAVGLPVTLADIGIEKLEREKAQNIASCATRSEESAHNEPFKVTKEGLVDAIITADQIGRNFKLSRL